MVKKKGFTLTEVLIVLVIVSLISLFFFFFLKILTQTSKFSLQKSEKSIIINTMVNLIREDLYGATKVSAEKNRIEIHNEQGTVIYTKKQGSLMRNRKILNNETFKITQFEMKKTERLYRIQFSTQEEIIEIKVFKRVL